MVTKYSVAVGLIVRSGGSRPSDKGGGGGHPDPEIRGGRGGHPDPEIMGAGLKIFFSTFQASVWSKNNGRPGPSPGSASELPTKSKNSIQTLTLKQHSLKRR